MPSSHLILCRPLLFLPSILPSIGVFPNESTLPMRWPKYWSFSISISPSNEHLGLISFRMDWLDLLAVQGTLKSLLQHHSSKASIFRCSAFLTVQLSHPYMTTGKTIALTRQTFVGKVMTLLLNMLSRLVIHQHKSAMGYICSPSWPSIPPPSQSHPSGSSKCTSPEHPVSCIEPGLVIYFTYDNVHVSMLFSQIIPTSSSPTEPKSLFFTSLSHLLSYT